MNYFSFHVGDYESNTAHLDWLEDAAYSRLIRVYYRTEKPIPVDLSEACRLVRAKSKAEQKAVQRVLGEYFELRPDGWHQDRCDDEIAKAIEVGAEREAKAENERERQRRHRDERKALFQKLRKFNLVPAWDTKTETLRAMLKNAERNAPVTVTGRDSHAPATCTATAIQYPIEDQELKKEQEPNGTKSSNPVIPLRSVGP